MRAREVEIDRELVGSLSKLRVERMKGELQMAENELAKRIPPPCGGCPAEWLELSRTRQKIIAPTYGRMLDTFEPLVWPSMFPSVFVYGDCVYGITRRSECDASGVKLSYRHRLQFREWTVNH